MNGQSIPSLTEEALALLQDLVSISSLSKEEHGTAEAIETYMKKYVPKVHRLKNNVWARNKYFDESKPTILLNSHHDTVPANGGYSRDPLFATMESGKLYGLGSNDAGGCLVSLLATFLFFYQKEDLPYNIIFAATAEEEISGKDGLELLFPQLGKIDVALVGEPTLMKLAIAEKGLMVIDAVAKGSAGHAARDEGENAIYKAIEDIERCKNFKFEKKSDLLGEMKMSVTVINGGLRHNMIPEECRFTIDIRINEHYTHQEVFDILSSQLQSDLTARSMRIQSSSIPVEHPLVQAGVQLGKSVYGSPTTSDQALINCLSLKMGPGDSVRSHSADEFIYVNEIENGINDYINMLQAFFKQAL